MNKIYFSFAIISLSLFCIPNSYAQTDEEKAEILKPLEKTLVAQLEIAIQLKDANTKKKASAIFESYKKNQLLDSIDVELKDDYVVSILFYVKDDYDQKNKFLVITDPKTKNTEVDMNATIDVVPLTPVD